jgi:chemotaxis protein CheX
MQDAGVDACSPALLVLPEVLDIKAATPLTVEFLTLRGRPIDVDASRVERLGALCLQVLLSAGKTWNIDESPFALINPSSGFIDGLARLGISIADFTGQDKTQ